MASTPIPMRFLAAVCALAGALLLSGVAAGEAHAGVVGSSGQISGCYAKKGKTKGTLRVVPPGKRCRKGEKPLTLNAQGQQGSTGSTGGQGVSGQLDSLTTQVSQLESRVTQLEGVLSGLTNTDLLSAVTNAAKLNGITAQDLTDAIAAVTDVNSLCTQMSTPVTQLNSIRTVLSGLSLTGVIPLGLGLTVPSIPSALTPFSC
jgi:hypothetical protein